MKIIQPKEASVTLDYLNSSDLNIPAETKIEVAAETHSNGASPIRIYTANDFKRAHDVYPFFDNAVLAFLLRVFKRLYSFCW